MRRVGGNETERDGEKKRKERNMIYGVSICIIEGKKMRVWFLKMLFLRECFPHTYLCRKYLLVIIL